MQLTPYTAPMFRKVNQRGKHKVEPGILELGKQVIREAVAKSLLKPRFAEWQPTAGDVIEISNDIFNHISNLGLKIR